jgi:hypothetical protein
MALCATLRRDKSGPRPSNLSHHIRMTRRQAAALAVHPEVDGSNSDSDSDSFCSPTASIATGTDVSFRIERPAAVRRASLGRYSHAGGERVVVDPRDASAGASGDPELYWHDAAPSPLAQSSQLPASMVSVPPSAVHVVPVGAHCPYAPSELESQQLAQAPDGLHAALQGIHSSQNAVIGGNTGSVITVEVEALRRLIHEEVRSALRLGALAASGPGSGADSGPGTSGHFQSQS